VCCSTALLHCRPSDPVLTVAGIGCIADVADRMMSGPVFLLPPMKDISRFFVRLDADSHITRPVITESDPLLAAAEGDKLYVFWSVALETCRYIFLHLS
jgi:hypothetical protein